MSSTTGADGTHTHSREESWHLPGGADTPIFDKDVLRFYLDVRSAAVRIWRQFI